MKYLLLVMLPFVSLAKTQIGFNAGATFNKLNSSNSIISNTKSVTGYDIGVFYKYYTKYGLVYGGSVSTQSLYTKTKNTSSSTTEKLPDYFYQYYSDANTCLNISIGYAFNLGKHTIEPYIDAGGGYSYNKQKPSQYNIYFPDGYSYNYGGGVQYGYNIKNILIGASISVKVNHLAFSNYVIKNATINSIIPKGFIAINF